jgi:hypothetical protein
MSTPALGFTRKHASGQVRGGARKRGPAPGGLERARVGKAIVSSVPVLAARAAGRKHSLQPWIPRKRGTPTRNAR